MKKQTRICIISIVILLPFLVGSFAIAQQPKVDSDAEKILNAYILAIGDEKALANIENIVIKSDLSIVEAGVIINREVVQDRANNLHVKAYSAQTGEIFRGYDGSIYWEKKGSSVSEIDDERILSFLNEFSFMRFSEWRKNLRVAEYLGLESIDGVDFQCIGVNTVYGVRERWYFNTTDFLLSYVKEQLESSGGAITVITKFEDYREVDGVKHSFFQHIKMGERNRQITHTSISHNRVIDPKLFTKPLSD